MTPILELVTSSGFGSLLGMRHALEPDHLAAVTTLLSTERSTVRAALLGLWWGLGHTLSLVTVAAAVVMLRAEIPGQLTVAFELLVALMLIALGARSLWQAARQGRSGPVFLHRHGPIVHSHSAVPHHLHFGEWTFARRPLLIGAIHGLAGSGALTALVVSTLPTTAARIGYVALFGIGSTIGMAALSGLLGWPLARIGAHQAFARTISLAVGFLSVALGIAWGARLL